MLSRYIHVVWFAKKLFRTGSDSSHVHVPSGGDSNLVSRCYFRIFVYGVCTSKTKVSCIYVDSLHTKVSGVDRFAELAIIL